MDSQAITGPHSTADSEGEADQRGPELASTPTAAPRLTATSVEATLSNKPVQERRAHSLLSRDELALVAARLIVFGFNGKGPTLNKHAKSMIARGKAFSCVRLKHTGGQSDLFFADYGDVQRWWYWATILHLLHGSTNTAHQMKELLMAVSVVTFAHCCLGLTS
jgi:hypothetical protein